uniref:Succinate dehydrogenase [ubiquinone] cytochrome b large subunit, mitochondrial n=2 Tax=Ascaris suum TaxID=6253 RepID=DHSC_ASCSU|nr:Chain C, Cytochrome b-large subunit [Ascaris suum]3VR8_G Chain G, Cytochrome b-large subunit [Ascaris suum]3VR9_C Chain C, Cytochrome b-large subunit [Ascaris suum]3VR9_G Chain G, Cytochrome b-large subunit [Ascaris suum]3VRA_C Chain C, Cytochrome b-large subunit [Ascaris suum]3VRA_G Chain G, Cytochrome b-large subunit [Ascaris suum]3VRB_C Chain C, Cytochrome b-large subunit [Ascaris suum]3VRB_G Chain G, Cytochrome b-large subunit [Ascaris suum]4YSX_C Chain C, Cytochrome b-large subunit 
MSLLPYNATLCRVLRHNVKFIRSVQTSAARVSAEKTPIQVWGWDYLMRQRALKRPIAPHLTIYKPQMTWMVSGLHRVTGCAMAGTLLIGGVGFSVLPLDFTTFVEFIRGLGIPWVILDTFKFIIAFPIAFHTLNGIRFIGFDMAKGTDIPSIYRGAYLVLGLAALISLAVVVYPRWERHKKATLPTNH